MAQLAVDAAADARIKYINATLEGVPTDPNSPNGKLLAQARSRRAAIAATVRSTAGWGEKRAVSVGRAKS
ncbi:hypothetical protein [Nocardia sp. CC227C]|uniref:hypothetical protein n=1 Tax=Nocardia sp. CC227C TaxID=3044562 RepID=UPI00278C8AE1|nr:hypothetical protein [Nocardia sp. CC227C]